MPWVADAPVAWTARGDYGLSSVLYGDMFLPQVVAAIAGSLLGAGLARRITTKRVYLLGLVCSLVSMGLLLASVPVKTDQSIAYPLLLVATASLGAGFGLTVPVLNTFTSLFHPEAVDKSVLVLNALLGLGTVLAPVFVAVFVGLGRWWGLGLCGLRRRVRHLRDDERQLVQLEATTRLGASATEASLALAAFWGMVTVGRVLFGLIDRWLPARITYHILPFVLVGTFVLLRVLSAHDTAAGIAVFGLAGLGCSALLPLTVSFSEQELTSVSAAAAGGVIAFYQAGYGIAAFGVGPLQHAGLSLPEIFGGTALVAAALAVLSFLVSPVRSGLRHGRVGGG